jgi:hypothetical protein
MEYQKNMFEKWVQEQINKLKREYVIDMITAERLQDILIYLYLSQESRNQRGVRLQTEKLKNLLHNCPKITTPGFSAQHQNRVHAV